MPPVLSISQLTKTYASGLRALEGVDLEIQKGEDLRAPGPQRRRQDHLLINIVCGIVTATSGMPSPSTATTTCATTASRAP